MQISMTGAECAVHQLSFLKWELLLQEIVSLIAALRLWLQFWAQCASCHEMLLRGCSGWWHSIISRPPPLLPSLVLTHWLLKQKEALSVMWEGLEVWPSNATEAQILTICSKNKPKHICTWCHCQLLLFKKERKPPSKVKICVFPWAFKQNKRLLLIWNYFPAFQQEKLFACWQLETRTGKTIPLPSP